MKKSFVLIILGIILYSFSLFNGFVWDDEVFLQQNPSYSRDASSLSSQTYFRPVMSVVYPILSSLSSGQPFIYHLFQVVFHIAIAVLLFYLFKRFFKENIAFFLSLLFLVHPANVESVCFASAGQEVLFTFTGLLGLYLLIRSKNITTITVAASIALCTLALLTKETGIVFFVLLFCYLLLFDRKNVGVIQLFIAFGTIVLFTYLFVRFSGGNTYVQGGGLFPIMRVSPGTRLMNIPMIILYYLGMFFIPLKLEIAQQWVIHTINVKEFWLPLLVDVGFFGLVIYVSFRFLRHAECNEASSEAKKDSSYVYRVTQNDTKFSNIKTFIFFFLWFIIGLLPHLQIVALNMTVAERWLYFPMIGLLGMMGAIMRHPEPAVGEVKDLASVTSETRRFAPRFFTSFSMTILGIIIISLFFLRSFVRTLDWHNGLALYSSNIAPASSFDLQNNMGVELYRAGKYAQAKGYFEKSVALAPYWWVNWNNLGASYEREQNFAKAAEYYQKSIQNGQYSLAYENMAKILVLHGTDKRRADDFLEKALLLFPENGTLQALQGYRQK